MNVGDKVGVIQKASKNGEEFWRLTEDVITQIAVTKKYGRRYYAKRFHPLDADDVDSNTRLMEEAVGKGYIFTREVFGLNENTRPFAERWVEWANNNMDKAVNCLDGL